jgi:hypothetical protein
MAHPVDWLSYRFWFQTYFYKTCAPRVSFNGNVPWDTFLGVDLPQWGEIIYLFIRMSKAKKKLVIVAVVSVVILFGFGVNLSSTFQNHERTTMANDMSSYAGAPEVMV